jgi:RimJ/RimL family protein N-acetyltransferase
MPDSTSSKPPAVFSLVTPRLLLRPWRPADAQAALAIYGDARVMRYLGSAGAGGGAPPIPDLETMRQRMQKWLEAPPQLQGLPGRLAIVEKASEIAIGTIILKHLPDGTGVPTSDVEVGWHLRPDRWGRGYATEAARTMLAYAWEILGLREVYAVVYKENEPSIAVCRRLGMEHLGATARYYGVTLELFRIDKDK